MSGEYETNTDAERELRRIQLDLYQSHDTDIGKLYERTEKNSNKIGRLETRVDTHEKRADLHDTRISKLEQGRHQSDERPAFSHAPQPPNNKGVPWLVIVVLGAFFLAAIVIAALIVGRPASDLLPVQP